MDLVVVKLYLFVSMIIVLPIVLKVWSFYMLQRLKVKKQKTRAVDTNDHELDDLINYKEIEPYAKKARILFHDLMKAGRLSHEQILYLKKSIFRDLGIYGADYRNCKFKNDCHAIYTYLKSTHLSVNNFQEIIQTLNLFYMTNEELQQEV